MKFRKEFDSIGQINVPVDKYWGASTQRSKKYFDIGKILVRPILIKSIAIIKKAAATVRCQEKQKRYFTVDSTKADAFASMSPSYAKYVFPNTNVKLQ